MLILAVNRLLSPGSPWRLHRQCFARSAPQDLLDAVEVIDPRSTHTAICCARSRRLTSIRWNTDGGNVSTSASMRGATSSPSLLRDRLHGLPGKSGLDRIGARALRERLMCPDPA